MKNIFDQVEANIDRLAETGVCWSGCASDVQMKSAGEGSLSLTLGINAPVPSEWLQNLQGKQVLCLAGAGGLQAPLLSASGADVTVIDLSENMLEKDRRMAEKYGLSICLEHGNMIDLSRFPDEFTELFFMARARKR